MFGNGFPASSATIASRCWVWVRTALLLTAGWAASTLAFAGYVFSTLTPVNQAGGGYQSVPYAINNLGQIVGVTNFFTGAPEYSRPTLWMNPATPVQLLSYGTSAYAVDINDAGVIAGREYYRDGPTEYAVKWDGGSRISLPHLGNSSSSAGINSSGQIAGNDGWSAIIWNSDGTATYLGRAVLTGINDSDQVTGTLGEDPARWTGTTPTVLGTLEGGFARTTGINNAGQVVGYSVNSNGNAHATLWNDIEAIDLGGLGGASYALGINSDGDIVGQANYAGGGSGAFLWTTDGLVDLNDLLDQEAANAGWQLYYASGINDAGQIIGVARNSITSQSQGFLLTPMDVPEPATYLLIITALGLMYFARRTQLPVRASPRCN
jgi:probable HAF family extracellular repeat protein